MTKNIEAASKGIKCDNPACDWKDESIEDESLYEYVNKPCPKCGENVLTEDDLINYLTVMHAVNMVNKMSPEDLEELSKAVDISSIMAHPMFAEAKGVENMATSDLVNMSVETHKEIKVVEITKAV